MALVGSRQQRRKHRIPERRRVRPALSPHGVPTGSEINRERYGLKCLTSQRIGPPAVAADAGTDHPEPAVAVVCRTMIRPSTPSVPLPDATQA